MFWNRLINKSFGKSLIAIFAILLCLSVFPSGCGRKAPPVPPGQTRPSAVNDLSSRIDKDMIEPKLSGFLLDLRRSLAHKGFAKILDISTGMPAVFANLYASRSQHISSQKIAQLRLKQ